MKEKRRKIKEELKLKGKTNDSGCVGSKFWQITEGEKIIFGEEGEKYGFKTAT